MATETAKRKSAQEIEALWRQYKASGNTRLRDRLVLTLSPLVKYIVFRKLREVPAHLEADDLISSGLVALINSIDRWDPEAGATLEQYAWTRVHGAIIDEMRAHDWAPRSLRRWQREMKKARDNFIALYGRVPTNSELACALGTSEQVLRSRMDDLARTEVESLNVDVLSDGESTIERIDTIESEDEETDPLVAYARAEGLDRFREALAKLPARHQMIVQLMYGEDMTLREIGETLGLTESRICQIHGQIKKRLREELSEQSALYV